MDTHQHGFAAPALWPAVAAPAAPAAASPAAHQGGVCCTSAAAPGQPIHTRSSFPVRTLAAAPGAAAKVLILNAPRTRTPAVFFWPWPLGWTLGSPTPG
jgi:hypothetical protein